jgi:hypothetical protein
MKTRYFPGGSPMKIDVSFPQLPDIPAITESKLMTLAVLIMAVTVCVLAWRKK